jgi:hypothetical protein
MAAAISAAEAGEMAQVARIDGLIQARWDALGVKPAERATDEEWCRRVYLDVIGRIPTVEELQAHLRDRSPRKRQLLVGRLLHDERYADAYCRQWSEIWANLLIGRGGGNPRNSLTSRAGLRTYLQEAFRRNTSYDRLVYELITACGASHPEQDGFNGAVNFLTMKLADEATQATAVTARLFLGLQVQCTQCHNHPFNQWKQNQFWELNSFFRQAVALRRFDGESGRLRYIELVDQDYAGQSGTPDEAEVFFELRNATLSAAYPVFVDGQALPERSGRLSVVNRRQELARLVVGSSYLSRAIVNRMWAHFLGFGFTTPVDDMGPHNTPSHPELLDFLAAEFVSQGHDLKRLVQWIVLSRPYGLSSRSAPTGDADDDPTLGHPPSFRRFYVRQMRAEELYESLVVAAEAGQERSASADGRQAERDRWLRQLATAAGTDAGEERTKYNGSIAQTLMLFNGALVQRAIDGLTGRPTAVSTRGHRGLREQVEHLFLATLSRQPSRRELQLAARVLAIPGNEPRASLQDLCWALINSNEFLLNH